MARGRLPDSRCPHENDIPRVDRQGPTLKPSPRAHIRSPTDATLGSLPRELAPPMRGPAVFEGGTPDTEEPQKADATGPT
eukprot:5499500-Pyramimonas_sp.AAC.1